MSLSIEKDYINLINAGTDEVADNFLESVNTSIMHSNFDSEDASNSQEDANVGSEYKISYAEKDAVDIYEAPVLSNDSQKKIDKEIICSDPMDDSDQSKFKLNLRKRSLSNSIEENYESGYQRLKSYSNETVKIAVKMVESSKMNLQEASREYKIPRTSLYNFVQLYRKGKRVNYKTSLSSITSQEEAEIVLLIMKLTRCGKRYSHNEFRYLVQYYLLRNDRPVFRSGTLPTMGWVAGLVERQSNLLRARSKKNTKVAVEDVEDWQLQIEDYLTNDWDVNISDMFSHVNGHRIFCFNAFRMLINSTADGADNKPSPIKKQATDEGKGDMEVGVVLGISADGRYLDPMIIIPEEKRDSCKPNENEELRIMFNCTGRVDEEVGLRIVRDFDNYILSKSITKPVVFFVNDKHDLAHFSVIEYCWENQIIIICLPPKTTKTLTPFEINIWPKIRASYTNLWKNASKNSHNRIEIGQFADLFMNAWDSVKLPKTAIRGFIRSGLIPFNVSGTLHEVNEQYEMQTKQQIQAVIDKQRLIQEDIDQRNRVQELQSSPVIFERKIKKEEISKSLNLPDGDFEDPEEGDEFIEYPCTNVEEHFSLNANHMEDRSRGKLEGIEMCLKTIESFIPPDVMPVWEQRGTDYRGRCELAFKLWRSVTLLLKAGCAMASIQQMSNNESMNRFQDDFSSTASFFQKSSPLASSNETTTFGSTSSKIMERKAMSTSIQHVTKKRKLKINKSLYSKSCSGINKSRFNQEIRGKLAEDRGRHLVKIYPNTFLESD